MGIRLVVVDDNPHLASDGRIHPVNATFERFVAALLDVPGSPVSSMTVCVPVRDALVAPATLPLDSRLTVVRTAPFDGIASYLRDLPSLTRVNRPVLRAAIRDADLVWLKVPASNAALAAAVARLAGARRFVWVAGSAADVAAARYHGVAGVAARAVGLGYDVVGRLVGLGGRRIVVGEGVVDRDGVVASLVEPDEVREPDGLGWRPAAHDGGRLVWAGRLASGKGLESLIAAIGRETSLRLEVVGDGPERGRLQALAHALGAAGRIEWSGFIADRRAYLDRLSAADAFVFPSPAEGFPKVVLDALAVGLPVLASPVGALRGLADARIVVPIERSERDGILAAWHGLRDRDPAAIEDLKRRGHDFAAAHTRPAEAARLVARWQTWWPDLPWDIGSA